jgi:hypothetical protein
VAKMAKWHVWTSRSSEFTLVTSTCVHGAKPEMFFFREPAGDRRVFILSERKDPMSKYMAEARRETSKGGHHFGSHQKQPPDALAYPSGIPTPTCDPHTPLIEDQAQG